MSKEKAQLFSTLNSYFQEIDGVREKGASVKAADNAIADPGGYAGKSTHPSASPGVADHLHAEQTGSRFTEHTTDVKKDVGSASVENLPEEASSPSNGSGNQAKRQPDIGVHNAATGEDTAVERNFKGDKDDPGTTSVMKADDGEKYSSWGIQKLASHLGNTGNQILADFATIGVKAASIGDNAPSRTQPVGRTTDATGKTKDKDKKGKDDEVTDEVKAAAARGYDLASALGNQTPSEEDNAAVMIEHIIKEAALQAELTADYLVGYNNQMRKQAGGEHPDGGAGEDHSSPGDDGSGANQGGDMGGPPGGDAGAGAGDDPMSIIAKLPPEVLAQLAQAIQGGGMGGAGGMDGGMGGGAGAMGAGAGPDAMAGMAGNGGGGMDGGLNDQQTDDQLTGAAQDMQLGPNEIDQMASKAAADQRPYLTKMAGRIRKHVLSGKYDSTKRASTPAEQEFRATVRGYLAEVISGM